MWKGGARSGKAVKKVNVWNIMNEHFEGRIDRGKHLWALLMIAECLAKNG
jgi:hypothetical protein